RALLRGTVLTGVNLTDTALIEADASTAEFIGSNLTRCCAYGAVWSNARLQGTLLEFSDLSGGSFFETDLPNVSSTRATLRHSSLERCHLDDVIAEFTDWRQVRMTGSSCKRVNLVGADLAGMTALSCNFQDADLFWAERNNFILSNCDTEHM